MSYWFSGVLVVLLLVAQPISAQNSMSFAIADSYAPAMIPGDLATAPISGSPHPDTVLIFGGQVSLRESQGFGVAPLIQSFNVVNAPTQIGLGDVDGDGEMDIIAGNATDVSVLRQLAGAWLRSDHALPAAGSISVRDVNGDGVRDILRGNFVLPGVLPGTFGTAIQAAGTPGVAADALPGDFNGDGMLDLVILRSVANPVPFPPSVFVDRYAGTGALTMNLAASFEIASCASTIGRAADLDGDGIDDVVILTDSFGIQAVLFDSSGLPTVLGRYYTSSASTFAASTSAAAKCLLRDLDFDGDVDLVARHNRYLQNSGAQNALIFALNDGTGRFSRSGVVTQQVVFGLPPLLGAFDVADVDQDGDGDIVRQFVDGSNLAANVETFLGSPVPAPPLQSAVAVAFVGPNPAAVLRGNNIGLVATVRVSDAVGNPVSGVGVTYAFNSPSGAIYQFPGTACGTVPTDVNGLAFPSGLASSATLLGNGTITATIGGGASATLSVNVVNATVSAFSGAGQARAIGQPFAYPLVVRVLEVPSGAPVAGMPIFFTLQTSGVPVFPTTGVYFTDALGKAAHFVTAGGFNSGTSIVRANATASPFVNFSLFIRKLAATGSGAGGALTVTYTHEDGPQPLILAADLPQPAPVITPYGPVHTSILSPGPGLVVFDHAGVFGNYDPTLLANPVFSRTYAVPIALIGFAFTLQIYGFDSSFYPDVSQAVFISNPANVVL